MDLHQICTAQVGCKHMFPPEQTCSKDGKCHICYHICTLCKYDSKCGIYHVCYRFALEETYVCIIFALCKFGVNPFFRLVFVTLQDLRYLDSTG